MARLLADSRPEGRGEADRDLTKTQRHTGPQMPPKVQGIEKRAKADETGAGTEDVQRWEVRLRSRKRTLFEDERRSVACLMYTIGAAPLSNATRIACSMDACLSHRFCNDSRHVSLPRRAGVYLLTYLRRTSARLARAAGTRRPRGVDAPPARPRWPVLARGGLRWAGPRRRGAFDDRRSSRRRGRTGSDK